MAKATHLRMESLVSSSKGKNRSSFWLNLVPLTVLTSTDRIHRM
ncbi:hypothetical protein HID58_000637 [Brassica napus]|uniref:Uncharacterized protein n=1 Tax=Brassica napus TaxID=3708 RepID=A0ABQ8EH80_BRANA|nr:hypothetical protein HID58_000637 [Brassica napus]